MQNVLIIFFSQFECFAVLWIIVDIAVLCSSGLWQSITEQQARKRVTQTNE